ncbi:SAF domain-containing protein [Arthrobacter halodurans]|uniref:SAF domain-containing protein n=1 Tax=Arthrobacter halodurans TaxID=516699 RepID=A0ABV4UM99_9MICC
MEKEAAPTDGARRLRKPGWRDTRLVVGVLLVLASVAGVVALVAALDRTVPMYVARDDISLGERVDASRLSVVDVRLDAAARNYLSAQADLDAGAQANTLIRAGELVPLRALGVPDASLRKPVTIELERSLPQAVAVGSRVDVWAGERDRSSNSYGQPALLLPAAEVSALRPLDSGFGGTGGTVLEVLVEDAQLAALLDALANEASITVVHNPGGAP